MSLAWWPPAKTGRARMRPRRPRSRSTTRIERSRVGLLQLALLPLADRRRLTGIVHRRQRQDVAVHLPVARTIQREWPRPGGLALDHIGERLVLHVDRRPAVRRDDAVA